MTESIYTDITTKLEIFIPRVKSNNCENLILVKMVIVLWYLSKCMII